MKVIVKIRALSLSIVNVNCFCNFIYFLTVIRSKASLNLCKLERKMRRTHISLTAEAFCLPSLPFSSVIANTFIPTL